MGEMSKHNEYSSWIWYRYTSVNSQCNTINAKKHSSDQ